MRYAGENTLRLTDFQIVNNNGGELRIISVEPRAGAIRVTWNSVGGKSYRVESTANLNSSFAEESPVIAAPGIGDSTLHFDITPSGGITNQFYRVRMIE